MTEININQVQYKNAETFMRLHQQDGCFLMPNAWDAGSAKMLAATGFQTIATTSAGIAFAKGKPDNVFCTPAMRLTRMEMIESICDITQAVSIPVNADLEAGFGDQPEDVATTISAAIAAGAVGGNIEDYTGDPKLPLYDIELAIERIIAAKEAIAASKIPFVLVARTDRLNIGQDGGTSEAIDRLNRYAQAGADCLFAPGLASLASIKSFINELSRPLSVVMGLNSNELNYLSLKEAGVRRISIGGSLARNLYFHMRVAAEEMFKRGTFEYAKHQISQSELNKLFEDAH